MNSFSAKRLSGRALSPRGKWDRITCHLTCCFFNVWTSFLNLATRGPIDGQRGVPLALLLFKLARAFTVPSSSSIDSQTSCELFLCAPIFLQVFCFQASCDHPKVWFFFFLGLFRSSLPIAFIFLVIMHSSSLFSLSRPALGFFRVLALTSASSSSSFHLGISFSFPLSVFTETFIIPSSSIHSDFSFFLHLQLSRDGSLETNCAYSCLVLWCTAFRECASFTTACCYLLPRQCRGLRMGSPGIAR